MTPDVPAATTRWLAQGEPDVPSSGAWLTDDEAARAAGMSFAKRRSEYLLRRWACKQAVAVMVGLPDDLPALARIEVTHRPSGAPAVTIDGVAAGFEVSLSDRAGWAVCAIGEAVGNVGCDLELVEPRSPEFVATFFTAAEQERVAAQSVTERDAAANLIWSAKESALKVLQIGLRRDTRSVEVVVGDPAAVGWAPLAVRTDAGDVLPGWWLRAGSFLLTVVAEVPLAAPQLLAGSVHLEDAQPVHSWVDRPRSP